MAKLIQIRAWHIDWRTEVAESKFRYPRALVEIQVWSTSLPRIPPFSCWQGILDLLQIRKARGFLLLLWQSRTRVFRLRLLWPPNQSYSLKNTAHGENIAPPSPMMCSLPKNCPWWPCLNPTPLPQWLFLNLSRQNFKLILLLRSMANCSSLASPLLSKPVPRLPKNVDAGKGKEDQNSSPIFKFVSRAPSSSNASATARKRPSIAAPYPNLMEKFQEMAQSHSSRLPSGEAEEIWQPLPIRRLCTTGKFRYRNWEKSERWF